LRLFVAADHPGIVEHAGDVAVTAARDERLQRETFVVELVRRTQQAAMHEGAVAPEIGAGKQQELRASSPARAGPVDTQTQQTRGTPRRRASPR